MKTRTGVLAFLIIIIVLLLYAIFRLTSGPALPTPPTQTAQAQLAQMLWQNPIPLPDFVRDFGILGSEKHYGTCINLIEGYIWEPGDEGGIYERVVRSARLSLDGISVNELTITSDMLLLSRTDEQGNYLGSHGGEINVCYYLADVELAPGLHLAVLTFEAPSGKKFEYQWAFMLTTDADGRLSIEYSPALLTANRH